MKHAPSLLIALALAGCSTQQSAPQPIADSPKLIYVMPQAQAFALAHRAMVSAPRSDPLGEYRIDAIDGQLRGYQLAYNGWSIRSFTQTLYVIPVAGTEAGGQEISGFRFLITGAGPKNGYAFVRAEAQDSSLTKALKEALDSTGTATPVTNLRVRPYEEEQRD